MVTHVVNQSKCKKNMVIVRMLFLSYISIGTDQIGTFFHNVNTVFKILPKILKILSQRKDKFIDFSVIVSQYKG